MPSLALDVQRGSIPGVPNVMGCFVIGQDSSIMLMMLVIANAADVIPGRGLMAAIALVHLRWPAASGYLRIFLSGDLLRNHVEVHHVVTRRSLVALRAVC